MGEKIVFLSLQTFPGHLVQAQCLQSPNQCRRTNCVHSILLTKDGEARVGRVTTKMRDYWLLTSAWVRIPSNFQGFIVRWTDFCATFSIKYFWVPWTMKLDLALHTRWSLDLGKMILASLVSNLLANDGWVCPSCDTLQFDKHHYCSLRELAPPRLLYPRLSLVVRVVAVRDIHWPAWRGWGSSPHTCWVTLVKNLSLIFNLLKVSLNRTRLYEMIRL